MESAQVEFSLAAGGVSVSVEGSTDEPDELIRLIARIVWLSAAQLSGSPTRKVVEEIAARALSPLVDE